MTIERRLQLLERLSPRRRSKPKPSKEDIEKLAKVRRIQRKLCLPAPVTATEDELAEGLRLMKSAQLAKSPVEDQTGWIAVKEYALSLHRKYGTDPYWGEEPPEDDELR